MTDTSAPRPPSPYYLARECVWGVVKGQCHSPMELLHVSSYDRIIIYPWMSFFLIIMSFHITHVGLSKGHFKVQMHMIIKFVTRVDSSLAETSQRLVIPRQQRPKENAFRVQDDLSHFWCQVFKCGKFAANSMFTKQSQPFV